MDSRRGRPLTPEVKKIAVSVKHYFDQAEITPYEPSVKRTSEALGIGVATVKRIMADYNRDPKLLEKPAVERGRPNYAVNISHQEAVRTYIRTANNEGRHVTLSDIQEFLKREYDDESFHKATLARTLSRWGFEFGKGVRSQHLKEKDYVVAARSRYLREKRDNRIHGSNTETKRPEVYLDESFVNKNHSNDFTWYFGEDGPWIKKPTGKGERLIILNAITSDGWVPRAKVVFKSTKKSGDYHGQINWELFKKWFTEMLLPNIPKGSLIIMDNAPYHNILADHSPPTPQSSKEKITEWLERNKIYCRKDSLKSELIEILKKMAPEPIYAIDELAAAHGHKILRTPPYHPELQPIEICWGIVKNYIANHCDFTMKNLIKKLDNGFEEVTQETCTKIIKKIKILEDEFCISDMKMDILR